MASRRLRNAPQEMGGAQKLKTQLGIAKRMVKEVSSYELEVVTNEARIQKMRDDGKDPYDIRKQEEVLQESYMMIPDSKARLEAVVEELRAAADGCEGEEDVDAAVLSEAREIITSVMTA
jgi:tubulin-specific chaperone A